MVDNRQMVDTRKISHDWSPFATPEQRRKQLQGFIGGAFTGFTELPLMIAEMLAPDAGYTPGELRSSPKDRLRAEQFEIEEFGEWLDSDPDMAKGSQLGYMASMVFDPVLDTGILAAPKVFKGLQGLGRAIESGDLVESAMTTGRRLATSERGAIELPTMSRGQNRFMRGSAGQPVPTPRDDIPIYPEVDTVPTVAQAVSKAKNMQWLKPKMIETGKGKSPLRYKPDYAVSDMIPDPSDPTGKKMIPREGAEKDFLGNMKMRQGNPSWEKGRQTVDYEGCGRGKFCTENEILADACYGGDCYAAAQAVRYGRDVMKTSFPPIRDQQVLGEMARAVERYGAEEAQKLYPGHIVTHYEELPNAALAQQQKANIQKSIDEVGLEETQRRFPQFLIKSRDEVGKVTARKRPVEEGARVTKDIKRDSMKGQDVRLGVDSDGGAWISNPEVMDSILAADPKIVSVYSSAYHTPPPPHPLSGRTIVNVTVSGWHPLPETLKRMEWAREARKNGWNVILREVTADPAMFGKEVDKNGISKVERYNRTREMINDSDFYIMEQPLHEGARYGEGLTLPACCKGGDCSGCRVAEGTGKEFFDFWGIEEDAPLFKDRPEWTKNRDRLDAELVRKSAVLGGDDYTELSNKLNTLMKQEPMKPRAFSTPQQDVSSAATSISYPDPEKKAPIIFNAFRDGKIKLGARNADIGGGRYDQVTDWLKEKHGITNLVWDRFNRETIHNDRVQRQLLQDPADTATISNVLNVIPDKENRLAVLETAYESVKPGGKVYISTYTAPKVGAVKGRDSYQTGMKTKEYIPEIEEVFGKGNVAKKGDILIAVRPIK